jgi:NAD(P)H-dependent FMN reductase
MESVYIPVVLGTGREGRESVKVARYIESLLRAESGVTTETVDVLDHLETHFTIPAWADDKRAEKWRKIARKADGFVFVVPEYNHSFPGEFKLLIDGAFKEYKDKPVGLVGVSDGKYGGVRMMEHLISLVLTLKMVPMPNTVATSNADKLFQDNGTPTDERYGEFARAMVKQLIEFINSK